MTVDHYYGRKVTAVSPEGEDQWWIELEGGVKIRNDAPGHPRPPLGKIVGEYLLNAILSQTSTVLNFGHQKPVQGGVEYEFVDSIAFGPTKYSISDPDVKEGEPDYPQKAPEALVPIPDPWLDQLTGPPPGSDSPLAPPLEGTESPQIAFHEEDESESTPDDPNA